MKNFVFICGLGDSYYHASIKPFADIAYGLSCTGSTSTLLLHEKNADLKDVIKDITDDQYQILTYRKSNAHNVIKGISPDYVVTDDYLVNMKTGIENRTSTSKLIIYAQILFGLSTLDPFIRRKSIVFLLSSLFPWHILTQRYVATISKANYIASNSHVSAFLLQHLYGIHSDAVIYPPVGVPMRKYIKLSENKKRNGMLIFMGRSEDYFLRNLKEEILNFKNLTNDPVKILVKDEMLSKMFRDSGAEIYSNVSSEKLSYLISSSLLTYVPTMAELFGHVGAESLMFRTPVLLDTYHPFLEMVPHWNEYVFISHPRESLYENYVRIIKSLDNRSIDNDAILDLYSASSSANSLERMVNY